MDRFPRTRHRFCVVDHAQRPSMDIFDKYETLDWPDNMLDLFVSRTQHPSNTSIVIMYLEKAVNQTWNQQHDKPRALSKFRHGKDHHHNSRDHCTHRTQYDAPFPVFVVGKGSDFGFDNLAWLHVSDFPGSHDHARLGHCEAEEDADSVQWDKGRCFGAEEDY